MMKWTDQKHTQQGRQSRSGIIRNVPGVKQSAKNNLTPLACWKLFIDSAMVAMVVTVTNKKIKIVLDHVVVAKHPTGKSPYLRSTDADEI